MALIGALPQPVILLACGSFNPITTMHLRMMELARDKLELGSPSSDPRRGIDDSQDQNSPAHSSCPSGSIVIGGVLSPTSDAYTKPHLLSAPLRIELARRACHFHSDWLAVDPWEGSQPTFIRTRVVADRLQSIVSRVWLDVARGGEGSFDTLKPGLASEAWIANCFRQLLTYVKETHTFPNTMLESDAKDGSISTPDLPYVSTICGSWTQPRVKLVCGADLVESFAVPNLWHEEDINVLVRDYGLICLSRPGADPENVISSLDPLRKNQENILHVYDECKNAVAATIVRQLLQARQSVRYLVPDSALDMIYDMGLYGAQRRWQRHVNPKCERDVNHSK